MAFTHLLAMPVENIWLIPGLGIEPSCPVYKFTALPTEVHSLTHRSSQPYPQKFTALPTEVHSLTHRSSQPYPQKFTQPYPQKFTALPTEVHSLTHRSPQPYPLKSTTLPTEPHTWMGMHHMITQPWQIFFSCLLLLYLLLPFKPKDYFISCRKSLNS